MKILMFFAEMEKIHPETHMKRNPSRQNNIGEKKKKETKLEDLIHSDFKIYWQRYGNQNTDMVAYRQTYRTAE